MSQHVGYLPEYLAVRRLHFYKRNFRQLGLSVVGISYWLY